VLALTNPVAEHHRYGDIWIVTVPPSPLRRPRTPVPVSLPASAEAATSPGDYLSGEAVTNRRRCPSLTPADAFAIV
jgi:hypothetical protein